jgi:hypothetical protein
VQQGESGRNPTGFLSLQCVGDQLPCADALKSWLIRKLRIVRLPQPRVCPRGSHTYPAVYRRKRPCRQVCHDCAHTHATLHARVVLPLQTASTRPPCISHPRRTMLHPAPQIPYRPSSSAHPSRTMPVPGTPRPVATPVACACSKCTYCRCVCPWITCQSTIPSMPENPVFCTWQRNAGDPGNKAEASAHGKGSGDSSVDAVEPGCLGADRHGERFFRSWTS